MFERRSTLTLKHMDFDAYKPPVRKRDIARWIVKLALARTQVLYIMMHAA